MPRATPIKNSFNSGEWSPIMVGRTDLGEHDRASRVIENWQLTPQGPIIRRSGTRHVAPVKVAAERVRLFPFVVSDIQSYILEFGNRYVRIYTNEGQLALQTLTIQSDQGVGTISDEFESEGHGYRNGDGPVFISTSDTLPPPLTAATNYYVHLAHPTNFLPADVSTANDEISIAGGHFYSDQMGPFQLSSSIELPPGLTTNTDYYIVLVSATLFGLSTSPGGGKVPITDFGSGVHTLAPTDGYLRDKFRVDVFSAGLGFIDLTGPGLGVHTITPQGSPLPAAEIATPYTTAELALLSFAQSADVLFIAHPLHAPQKLQRFSPGGFFLEPIDFIDGPYLDENVTSTTVTPSANTGIVTLTASSAIFRGSDIGRPIRIRGADYWGYAKITEVGGVVFQDSDIEFDNFNDADVTIDPTNTITLTAHGFDTGELVRLLAGDVALPTGLAAGTDYYLQDIGPNTVSLHTTKADAIANDNRVVITGVVGGGLGHRITSSVIDIVHGYTGGEGPVQLTNQGGGLPLGLSLATNYFIGFVDANSFTLSLSRGGIPAGIDENAGGGRHTAHGGTVPQVTCQAEVRADFQATPTTTTWQLGAWSNDPDIGYPRAVSFDKNRLWWAGNAGAPQTMYGSKANDFESHSPSGFISAVATDENLDDVVSPDNGIVYELGGDKVNVIVWLRSARSLLAGTSSAVWADTVPLDQAVEPANFKMRKSPENGAAAVVPQAIDNRLLYVSKTNRKIYSLGYEFEADDYEADDLTLLSEHVTQSGVLETAAAREPWSDFFAVRADGQLGVLVVVRKQEISGWGRHVIGGTHVAAFDTTFAGFNVNTSTDEIQFILAHGWENGQRVRFKKFTGELAEPLLENRDYYVRAITDLIVAVYNTERDAINDTNRIDLTSVGGSQLSGAATAAIVESVAVIQSPGGDPSGTGRENVSHDQVWLSVLRTVNGVSRRDIEFIEDDFVQDEGLGAGNLEDAFHVDGGVTYNGVATNTLTGLTHLAGEAVDVNADGRRFRDIGVTAAGGLTLPDDLTALKIHVGNRFASRWRSLRMAVPDQEGTAETKLKRIDHVALRLNATVGGSFGPDEDNLEDLTDRLLPMNHLMDEIPPTFSGDIEVPLDGPWESYGEVFIQQDDPFPFTLVALVMPMQTSQRGSRNR